MGKKTRPTCIVPDHSLRVILIRQDGSVVLSSSSVCCPCWQPFECMRKEPAAEQRCIQCICLTARCIACQYMICLSAAISCDSYDYCLAVQSLELCPATRHLVAVPASCAICSSMSVTTPVEKPYVSKKKPQETYSLDSVAQCLMCRRHLQKPKPLLRHRHG